jgi:hypothetical protein
VRGRICYRRDVSETDLSWRWNDIINPPSIALDWRNRGARVLRVNSMVPDAVGDKGEPTCHLDVPLTCPFDVQPTALKASCVAREFLDDSRPLEPGQHLPPKHIRLSPFFPRRVGAGLKPVEAPSGGGCRVVFFFYLQRR